MITNTHSVGVVRDAVIAWKVKHGSPDMEGYWWSLPVVAETWDGYLNDINGFHVKPEDAFHALDSVRTGPVEEGNVGGGTGIICNEFKGGIGTSSRVLDEKAGGYTIGVLVQCNYGSREQLRIAGINVGREIPERTIFRDDVGSIIVVLATDAPLIPTQLKRVARKISLGLGRDGSYYGDGSGDIFIAFSTANPGAAGDTGVCRPPPGRYGSGGAGAEGRLARSRRSNPSPATRTSLPTCATSVATRPWSTASRCTSCAAISTATPS